MKSSLGKYATLLTCAAALGACAPMQTGQIAVHEVQLYGQNAQRLLWAYGGPAGETTKQMQVDGRDIQLQAGGTSSTSLLMDGKPFLALPLEAKVPLPRAVLGTDGLFDITGGTELSALYYWEGQQWFRLQATSGHDIAAVPIDRTQAQWGDLTATESNQLRQALESNRSILLGVLPARSAPTARLTVKPQPADSRLTALIVTQPTVQQATLPSSAQPVYSEPTPTPAKDENGGSTVQANVIARGSNAAVTSSTYTVANTRQQVEQLYSVAYGRQSPVPTPPELAGRTLVGIFLGQRMTGGYGLSVTSVSYAGDTATIHVRETRPSSDMLTTQALTSPWVIVALDGEFATVRVEGLGQGTSPSRGDWQVQ